MPSEPYFDNSTVCGKVEERRVVKLGAWAEFETRRSAGNVQSVEFRNRAQWSFRNSTLFHFRADRRVVKTASEGISKLDGLPKFGRASSFELGSFDRILAPMLKNRACVQAADHEIDIILDLGT